MDVHNFNRFFTYQLTGPSTTVVQARFDPRNHTREDGQDARTIPEDPGEMIFRLRATLRSPSMDHTQQSMRVTLMEEEGGRVLADGSTEDHDERSVHLDSISLTPAQAYVLKYEFFQKNSAVGEEAEGISSAHMGASACSRPFVVAELVVASKSLLQKRVEAYKGNEHDWKAALPEKDIGQLKCDFATLDNTAQDLQHGERGLYCDRAAYTYSLAGQSPQELNQIFSKEFTIAGAEDEPVTYLFDLTLGFEFATSAQLKAVLQRMDGRPEAEKFVYDPLACLYDHSCVESELVSKNEVGIDVILTQGKYKLTIFDQEENAVRRWLTHDAGLAIVPFSFELQAIPVVQNEERVMCGDKFYLAQSFIQSRFIEHRDGERFVFDDYILLSLIDTTQTIEITPEADMLLKVSSKEAYGVNMKIRLLQARQGTSSAQSQKVGNTEILYAAVKKGQTYHLELDFTNSIITLSSFFDCPNAHLQIAMVREAEARASIKEQHEKPHDFVLKETRAVREKLSTMFNLVSMQKGQTLGKPMDLVGDGTLFYHEAHFNPGAAASSAVVTYQDFSIQGGEPHHVHIEVFFEPQFYDLEILIVSKDAGETQKYHDRRASTPDITQYKGSKILCSDLEPGDYTFKIIARLPGTDKTTEDFVPRFFEFQMFAVAGEAKPHQQIRPATLNYFGLLGPHGENFGSFVHILRDVEIFGSEIIELEFLLSGAKTAGGQGPSIDVQVVDIDGDGDQLDLSLTKVPKKKAQDEPDYLYVQDDEEKPHTERYMDSHEDGVTYESLVAQDIAKNTAYRVSIKNRDGTGVATVTIKLTVTERGESGRTGFLSGHPAELVPRSFEEVTRIKPKVPGLKESSFIQGSRAVMDTFKVSSLVPFIPKSQKVYQGNFATGARSQDTFVPPLDFEIEEESALLFAQVQEFSGREDLFLTVYARDGRDQGEVARSALGKYANALGPAVLTKGKYRLVIHPDQDSKTLAEGSELIRFGLDVLLEKSSIGGAKDFDLVVEEVELCSLPALPSSFNGPGFLHPLSGNGVETAGNYRLSELLAGTTVKFEVREPSTMTFYIALPEGVHGEAELERVKGVHNTRVFSEDLNKGDETFLRREGGFQHRAVIQIREFLDAGSYLIRIQGRDATRGNQRVMPRCEAYQMALLMAPLASDAPVFSTDEDCLDSQFLPEHLAFDEVKQGNLTYPVSVNTVDVAYLDLKSNGEGPFMFFFQIQYDPRILGVVALSLSKYDQDTSSFEQAALYRTPQDGATQVMTVVESGTYAIGIQTLTSTPGMHVSGGLSGEQRALLGTRLLHETCFQVQYTYLVASTKKGDSRALQGGPLGLIGLLFGGGLGKMARQAERDGRLLDELGDTDWLGNCPHDDLPHLLPVSEGGFDKALRLRVQERPADVLDLVVERESLLRITIHSSNSRNQVRAFLYEDAAATTALAWTTGSRSASTLLHPLAAQQKAYRLKIEYEGLDQADPCPTFDIRIIVKAIEDVVHENLRCQASPLLPPAVAVHSDDFAWSGSFAFPSDYVTKATEGRGGSLEYDLLLEWATADPSASYYLDIEAESDFLSGQVAFSLLYEGKDRSLRPLGRSHPLPSAAGGGHLIERLKLLDREGDLADDVALTGAVLRVSLPSEAVELLSVLKARGYLDQGRKEVCHNFQLSVRAELRGARNATRAQSAEAPRLMRVRWDGLRIADGVFDPRTRLVAALEFDRSLSGAYQLLKTGEWAGLTQEPASSAEGTQAASHSAPHVVNPTVKTLAPGDTSTVLLQFAAGSLARGACHRLSLHSPHGAFGPMLAVPDFDETVLAPDLKVCTTSCLCDWIGTSSCQEETGECFCRAAHVGAACSECAPGHARDPETGGCGPISTCAELGGHEDCQGHGTCEQRGQTAVCACDEGFAHDGLLQCARCADPLFSFPECSQRAWILEEPDVNCRDLTWPMPTDLSAPSDKRTGALQGEDGVLNWAHKYRLTQGAHLRHASAHTFVVPTTSVLRLFLDTVGSGALVKYRLLDDQFEELLSSADYVGDADADGFVGTGSEITLVHQPEEGDPVDSPYTLHLEYKHEAGTYEEPFEDDACPVIDVRLIVEPLVTAQAALSCSGPELAKANEPRTTGWEFGRSTRFESQRVVVQSGDSSLFEHDGHESSTFALVRYDLTVHDSGNALSVVATYPFSTMAMSMALIDSSTGDVVELELTSSLEGEGDSAPSLTTENDMASYIEVPALDAGRYVLEIALQRSLFLPTKQHQTCLSFDLVVEYVVRQHGGHDDGMYEVLAVRPLYLDAIKASEEKVIEVDFDRPVVLDDLVGGLADRFYVCSLYAQEDGSVIHPRSARQEREGRVLRLDFDFAKASPSPQGRCYTLKCSSKDTNPLGREMIRPMQEETRYCFESASELAHDALARCNPNALPKLDQSEHGHCICAEPYTGSDCEKCEAGFKPARHDATREQGNPHTVCVIDHDHVTAVVCNSHGRAKSAGGFTSVKQVACECDEGYGGKHCDYCTDPTRAYPDCVAGISSAIYDPTAAHAFLARRRYNEHGYSTAAARYFSEGELEPTVFNEECGWVDYPDNFDRMEFMREFTGGEFHLADLYVVNHEQDNIIKFRPRGVGIFKMLVQQPEAEEVLAGAGEAAFDLEIGIYDPESKKFLESGMNRKMMLPGHRAIKLEYAQVTFEVTEERVGKPFYAFFRALNFTDDSGEGHAQSEGCLALYLEAEFNAHPDQARHCSNDAALEAGKRVESLKDTHPLAGTLGRGRKQGDSNPSYTIADARSSFFTYRDYYVPDLGVRASRGADHEVTISLQQKFIEENTLDFLVEILDTDIEHKDISQESHSPQLHAVYDSQAEKGLMTRHHSGDEGEEIQGALGPSCRGLCLIGGEKAHNEMQRVLELSPKTYFRVWLLQQTSQGHNYHSCANYQLHVQATPIRSKTSSSLNSVLRCPNEELPASLNTPRYLSGLDGQQKDFHYRTSYRVDHLQHNQGHLMSFNLSEPTVLRVLAPVHKHLDFELLLNEEHGPYNHKTLVKAKQEDKHSTIFAQLGAGSYHIRLAFMSDAAVLQLPCQTVQLELAMMTVERASAKAALLKEHHDPRAQRDLSLSELLAHSSTAPMTLFRPAAFGWRHIEAGKPPYVDTDGLYVEVLRESFEVAEDDDAGLVVELVSDFLLSGVNLAINNVATGQVVEDERRDSSGKLVVGHLVPGPYELIVYTHECVTNMDPAHGKAISSFDLLLSMSTRLLRVADRFEDGALTAASVPVEILDYSGSRSGQDDQPHVEAQSQAAPLVATYEQLTCMKEFLPLPESLDFWAATGALDIHEAFFVPTTAYYSHEVRFTPQAGQDAIRVFLAKANSKMAILEESGRSLVAESKSQEEGDAQLVVATDLRVGAHYLILLEFSAEPGSLDGAASEACDHFYLAFKTWDSDSICSSAISEPGPATVVATADSGYQVFTAALQQKFLKKELRIEGSGPVDLLVTVDHSDAFYRAGFSIKAVLVVPAEPGSGKEGEEGAAVEETTLVRAPQSTDYSHKHSTSYYFADVPQGQYVMKLRQRFKSKGCSSSVSFSVKSWKASAGQASFAQHGAGALNLYQSQAEEQERPRIATRLPMDLSSYKYLGGEHAFPTQTGHAGYILFSGPVQLSEMETQNTITFPIAQNDTLVRFYAEHAELSFTLRDVSSKHASVISQSPAGASLIRTLSKGTYRVQLGHATSHARKNAAMLPPRTQLTILLADTEVQTYHRQSWSNLDGGCDADANFPLALNQKKQTDSHQLYYNSPLLKVAPHILQSKQVVQTYNFRVNVTSRMYFEIGMHLLSSQVSLQLNALNERGYSIQGKQRGNLNVLDVQVGPGDYSIALKQPSLAGAHLIHDCGAYSLQGLIEPIDLMSASQNSGEILQRGIAECSEGADGDQLPSKIFGSKAHTRGGGELHVDASGHFMRRFRNVVQKLTRTETTPEFDRVEIEVVEDAWLHLSFLYEAFGANEIRAVLSDTLMLGQTTRPSSEFTLRDVEQDRNELVMKYKLDKGRHYALTVYYIGGPKAGMGGSTECSLYDLTISVSHADGLMHETRCPEGGSSQTWGSGLPKTIRDSDLDRDGRYTFEQVLQLDYPKDFKDLEKVSERVDQKTVTMDVLRAHIPIEISTNFDLSASVDFEFDQGLFSMELYEFVTDEEGAMFAEQSHQQSPLDFEGNDDHLRTVRRELIADDVASAGKHYLRIANRQPEMLHLLNPDSASDACMYVAVKIHVQSSKKSTANLYKESSTRHGTSPTILGCDPADSPTFLHGRPSVVAYAIRLNKRPYLRGIEMHEQDVHDIYKAIKLKVALVTLPDGIQSTIYRGPSEIVASQKEYAQEYHVTVKFDVSEYERSATEKMMHAQLVIHEEELIDEDKKAFSTDKLLAARGLPIYVFESNDGKQLFEEEGNAVGRVIEGTDFGRYSNMDEAAGRVTTTTGLEDKVQQLTHVEPEVKCLCVHGICKKGESECSGRCLDGWSGPHCDTPGRTQLKPTQIDNIDHIDNNGQPRGGQQTRPTPETNLDRTIKPQRIEPEQPIHQAPSPGPIIQTPPEYPIEASIANNSPSGDDARHFSITALLVLGLVVGVVYALGQLGVRVPVPWRSPAGAQGRYGQLRRDPAADSDGEDDGDDPAARRRMLELSTFGEKTGPKSRRAKGAAMASISAEENQSSYAQEGSRRADFPMTELTAPSGAGAQSRSQRRNNPGTAAETGKESTAEQLQRELELFAQDDEEEGSSLIKTDYEENDAFMDYQQPQGQNQGEEDEAELQEYENFFDQNQ